MFDGREVQISDVSRCNKPLEQKASALFYHLTGVVSSVVETVGLSALAVLRVPSVRFLPRKEGIAEGIVLRLVGPHQPERRIRLTRRPCGASRQRPPATWAGGRRSFRLRRWCRQDAGLVVERHLADVLQDEGLLEFAPLQPVQLPVQRPGVHTAQGGRLARRPLCCSNSLMPACSGCPCPARGSGPAAFGSLKCSSTAPRFRVRK